MERTALFYMANAYPEIGRVFSYYETGNTIAAAAAQKRAITIVDTIISRRDVSAAGREEWRAANSLLEGYEKLDAYSRKVLKTFAEPFSYKFIQEYTNEK